MTLTILEYNQPDSSIFKGNSDGFLVWKPDGYYLVLGQSNTAERSLFIENVIRDGIPVTKRPTGGEAVLLTPSTIAVTVAKEFPVAILFKDFFRIINNLIMESLTEKGIAGLSSKGISDIAIGNKKILGSSMRCIRNRLVFHAVLNISEDPEIFEKYLRHPRREPDYRASRSHNEFVTSLETEGYNVSADDLIRSISNKISSYLSRQ